jgi:glycosyltransferase involved in cell wall biosynthesis
VTGADTVWEKYASQIPGLLERRPDFRFDPDYYASKTGLVGASLDAIREHFDAHAHEHEAKANKYHEYAKHSDEVQKVLCELVGDEEIEALLREGVPLAVELLFELISLGDPIDSQASRFSVAHYIMSHPDIAAANVDPLYHYLNFGAKEGRATLGTIREAKHVGRISFDPAKPTVLVCVHEMSRTGAPIVGLDIAREACETHNVIVASLRDGPLLEEFTQFATEVLITDKTRTEFRFLSSVAAKDIDFAILNSVVCFPFISFVVEAEIPFASYIHEYAQYTRPSYPFNFVLLYSDLLVFSSQHVRDSWRDRMLDVNFNVDLDTAIVPQRLPTLGGVSADVLSNSRERLSRQIGRDLTKTRIVCGAGQPQWRKGTDIFVMAAQICRSRDPDTLFVWIGHGVQHDELHFGAYMTHHLDQVGVGEKDSNVIFLEAGPAYKDLLAASDVMFMSSRLDPLPNVVFDALEHGCKVIQFEGASGFTDEDYKKLGMFATVEFGNPEAAVEEILKTPRKQATARQGRDDQLDLFRMLSDALTKRLGQQRYFVTGVSRIDEPVMFTSSAADADARALERIKMFQYGRRRLWRDLDDVRSELKSSDNWVHKTLRLAPYEVSSGETLPAFSMHIHAHYTDELASDIVAFGMYREAKRVVVTTDTHKKKGAILKIMEPHGIRPEVVLVPNTGRDILPFIKLFEKGGVAGEDEFWCHVHQKKSLTSTSGGDRWRRFLLRILLGDASRASSAFAKLTRAGVGLVAPFDPHFIGWDDSRRLLPKFDGRLPGPFPENPLLFPVGNMFWVRRSVAEAMVEFFGPDYAWPGEPISNDGTEYHLIERLWPAIAASLELESVFVHKLDEKRL